MASGLEILSTSICSYKQSIVNVLEDMDQTISQYRCLWENPIEHEREFRISATMGKILNNFISVKYICKQSLDDLRQDLEQISKETQCVQQQRQWPSLFSVAESKNTDGSSESIYFSSSGTVCPDGHLVADGLSFEMENSVSLKVESDSHEELSDTSPKMSEVSDVQELLELFKANEGNTEIGICATESDEHRCSLNNKTSLTNPFSPDFTQNRSVVNHSSANETAVSNIDNQAKVGSLQMKISTRTIPDRLEEAQKKLISTDNDIDLSLKPIKSEKLSKSKIAYKEMKKSKHKNDFEIGDFCLQTYGYCNICYVMTPAEFYVRVDQKLFELLEKDFNSFLNSHLFTVNSCKSKAEAMDLIKKFGFVYCSEKQIWVRVEVLDWMKDNEESYVLLKCIDYGYKTTCPYNRIKPMTAEYAMYPRMATKCHFAFLQRLSNARLWPEDSIAILWEYELLQLQLLHAEKIGDSYAIDLWDFEHGQSIGEFLVAESLAIYSVPYVHTLIAEKDVVEKEEHEDFRLESDNINEAITGYDAKDEARICPFVDETGRCFKGPSCQLEHTPLSKDGITTDKTLTTFVTLSDVVYPANGNRICVLITAYINLCNFYVQIIENISSKLTSYDSFLRLREAMQLNQRVQSYESFKVYPGVGELVLVKHDNEWHRGRCIEYEEEETFEIFFIDYGFKAKKKLTELRQISEEFLYLSPQAVECILHDVEEQKDISSSESENFFFSVLNMKQFKATVVETMEPLQLKLWDENGVNVSEMLTSCGFATNRSINFFAHKDQLSLM